MASCEQFRDFPSFSVLLKPGEGTFTVFHANVRSIRKHWNEFCVHAGAVRDIADVFVLTEINIGQEHTGLFQLQGYHNHFLTRKDGRGGGIAIFIKNCWISSPLNITFTSAESLALRIHTRSFAITLLAIYRPPNQSVRKFVDELHLLAFPSGHVCMIGDVNIDVLKKERHIVADYLNTLADVGIDSIINLPTRVEILGTSLVSSCIDHVNVRTENDQVLPFIIEQKLSDHFYVGCSFLSSQHAAANNPVSQIEVIDKRKLDSLLQGYDWKSFLAEVPASHLYKSFIAVYTQAVHSCKNVVVLKQRKPKCPWINGNALTALAEKELAWARCRRSPNNQYLREAYKMARNKVTAVLRGARRQHFQGKFSEFRNNPSKTWSVVNELRGRPRKGAYQTIAKNFGPPSITLADQFNSFFSSTAASLSGNTASYCMPQSVVDSAFLPECTEDDIRYILFNLKQHKSVGLDGVSVDVLRRNFEALKNVLLAIINNIITTKEIPPGLKEALVVPLFKSGQVNVVTNYRPISILSCIALILEKHIFHVMQSFIDAHNIMSPNQYGFTCGRGTRLALDELTDFLNSTLEISAFACALFLDVSKAFDSVNHEILLCKLHSYGFRGPFLTFLENYLHGRIQVVVLGNIKSKPRQLSAGVPQGSILAPLLFNLYVNDLSQAIFRCRVFQYADDTLLVSRHTNYHQAVAELQTDTTNVISWYRKNLISINQNKTKLVCFHDPLKSIPVITPLFLHSPLCNNCSCSPIPYLSSVNYLGVHFDSNMSWNTHLANVCERLRKIACLLHSIKALCPIYVRKTIAHALAYSVLRYGICSFYFCSVFWRNKVDSLLKSIIRAVMYGVHITNNSSLFHARTCPRSGCYSKKR